MIGIFEVYSLIISYLNFKHPMLQLMFLYFIAHE